MDTLDDQKLIEAINKGDKKAFEILYNKYSSLVFGLSVKILKNIPMAEDMAQNTWIKIATHSNSYSPVGSVKSWILQINRNLILDELRRSKKWKYDEEIDQLDVVDESESVIDQLVSKLEKQLFDKAFSELDPQTQLVLSALIIEDKSYAEIAKVTGLTVANIKTLVFRGKNKMVEVIQNEKK